MVKTPDPMALGHFRPLDLNSNKLGKGLLGHATYQISSTAEPSGSEEDF